MDYEFGGKYIVVFSFLYRSTTVDLMMFLLTKMKTHSKDIHSELRIAGCHFRSENRAGLL